MRAWRLHTLDGPAALRLEEAADPAPAEDGVIVRMRGAGINFPDALITRGLYQDRPELPFTPGFELAGVVEQAGSSSRFRPGDRVTATGGMGAYAELAAYPDHYVFPLADPVPFDVGAAMTITYQTAWFALHRRARVQGGETVLVHAGAGGVGSATIQLARAAGARVIATASAGKLETCRGLGADIVIDYRKDDFVAEVREATGGRGADVIIDPVGGDTFSRSTKCVAFEGRIVLIGFTSGGFGEVRSNHVLIKNYSLHGLHWGLYLRLRSPLPAEVQEQLYLLYAEGAIDPLISRRVPFTDLPGAIEDVAAGRTVGKTILEPPT